LAPGASYTGRADALKWQRVAAAPRGHLGGDSAARRPAAATRSARGRP